MTGYGDTEAGYIALLRDVLEVSAVPEGPGDDAALIPTDRDGGLVLTTDALIEGVHFFRGHPAEALGWKALAANVSDVGAMGAAPTAFVLTVGLPSRLPVGWFGWFARGLAACARRYGVRLAGGDTVRSRGPLVISITAWGWAEGGELLTRGGASCGDVLWATGPIGRAGAGFERWRRHEGRDAWVVGALSPEQAADGALVAHLRPEPAVDQGAWALAHGATAGLDLSDGLITDLPRLADASDVTIRVDLDALPDDPDALDDRLARAAAGEDYGLAVLAPPSVNAAFEAAGWVAIGRAERRLPGVRDSVVWRAGGADVEPGEAPFRHFEEG